MQVRLVACALALGSLAGCKDDHVVDMPADSAEPLVPIEIPMNIVVGDHSLVLYMNGRDKVGCDCLPVEFLAVGERGIGSDAQPCGLPSNCPAGSCITELGVEVDGARLATHDMDLYLEDPWVLPYDPFPTGVTTLVIAGCGHPETRIPIGRPALPIVTVTADYVAGHPHVSWTTSIPAVSAMVSISAPTAGGHGAHVPGSETEYTETELWSAFFASVTAYVSSVEVATEFGPATVWHAGVGSARFPP